jgi:hypothetical protein
MRACFVLALIVVAVCVVGCGDRPPAASHTANGQVTLAERKAIFSDWYADGRIDGNYRCAIVQNAVRHLPSSPPMYSTVLQDFRRYEGRVC